MSWYDHREQRGVAELRVAGQREAQHDEVHQVGAVRQPAQRVEAAPLQRTARRRCGQTHPHFMSYVKLTTSRNAVRDS